MTMIKAANAAIRQTLCLVLMTMVLILLAGSIPAQAGTIIINEIFADPATDLTGDANGDGVRGAYDDEFIELVNGADNSIDYSI